jgi:hypothetical protein
MSLESTQFEALANDQPVIIPMGDDGTYLLGEVEGGRRFVSDRAVAIVIDEPSVSTGSFSIGTNAPDYNNILAPIPWNLLTLGVEQARDYPILENGHTSPCVPPSVGIYLKVTRGLLDVGGTARLVLFGFAYPES